MEGQIPQQYQPPLTVPVNVNYIGSKMSGKK